MTPTGRERVMTLLGDRVQQAYLPYDLPCLLKRFLKRVNPTLLIIVDTELWPNMLHLNQLYGVRTLLINGRLSSRSARGYAKVPKLIDKMLQDLSHVAIQTENQGNRFLSLGLRPDKLSVTGSIKFDLRRPLDLEEKKSAYQEKTGGGRLILVAGSTHKGEEEALIQSCRDLERDHGEILLILAPRHPHRFEDVASLLKRENINYVTFSSAAKCDKETKVLLVDALGELLYFYGIADIAFVGGSLVPVGGHNLMEAAAFGLPILMGKHIDNIEDIASQFSENGALKLVVQSELTEEIRLLVNDPQERQFRGAKALEVMDKNKGALGRVEALINRYL